MAAEQHNATDPHATDTELDKCVCGADPVEKEETQGVSIGCSQCDKKTEVYGERSAAVSFWNMKLWAEAGWSSVKDDAIERALQIIREDPDIDAPREVVIEAVIGLLKAVDESSSPDTKYIPVIRTSIKREVERLLAAQ